ncbi:MAG: CotH kinase family protein [Bacteroidetes bacterium]|nr:CotH kinase family protein [Bacteroidota bacterium]
MGLFNNGQNPNGNWTLILHDTYPFADEGFLIGWGVIFGTQPVHPFVFPSSNLPIVKITTQNSVVIPNDPKIEADFVIIDHGSGIRNYVNDTVYAYQGKMLVELQGFSGPSYPKKNYDFDLIDANGNKINTPLLGMPAENDWILKAEYLDASLMANPLTYELSRRMGLYAPRTKYCEVMVNNEYVGVYSLTEKVKRSAERLNIAKLNPEDTTGIELTGGYIIEMNINGDAPAWTSNFLPINYSTCSLNVEFKEVYPKQGTIHPKQHNYIKSYVDSFELALHDGSIGLQHWRDFISEKSFIDFQIVNEFSANYDSYGRSTYLYKEKSTDGNQLHIGPPWDYDRAFASGTQTGWVWEITHLGWPFPFWWSQLNNDSVYQRKLYCRWSTLRMNVLSTDSFMHFIDSTSYMLQEAAARNFTKWGELGVTDYNSPVLNFKNFIQDRLQWMDNNILPHGAIVPALAINDTIVCQNGTIDISIGNQYSYSWNTNQHTSAISIATSGLYSVSVKDGYGCSASSDFQVTVSTPDATFGWTEDSISSYTFVPNQVSNVTYVWNFGDGNTAKDVPATHAYDTTGLYIVTLSVTDTLGCTASSTDTITVTPFTSTDKLVAGFNNHVTPNPFTHQLEVTTSILNVHLEARDVTGKLVFEKTCEDYHTRIETNQWSSGFYFLKINKEGFPTLISKVVKQ